MTPLWLTLCVALAAPPPKAPDPGLLTLVVFAQDGAPLAGEPLDVLAADTVHHLVTDRRGVARVLLSEGDATLAIVRADTTLTTGPVSVVSGHVSEVLVTLGDTLTLIAEVPRAIARPTIEDGPTGTLSGVVFDSRGAPLQGARVFVRGLERDVTTDAHGRFAVVASAGSIDLTVVHPRHSPHTRRGVEVAADAVTTLDVTLEPAAAELESFVVSAPRIVGSTLDVLAERRNQTAVGEVLGAEQIARAGDSSAASALRRATGVTVVDGRFVYVRGLGDRYASALLDGAGLPSPEPERRVVPLDLFPTSLIEGLAIQKAWTPDMPGEFGGGVVQIRTRSFPAEPTGRVQLSTGVRLGTTFERGLMGRGGPTDILGLDGGHRDLPAEVRAASERAPLLERDMFSERGYSSEELERFGELMTTDWTPTRHLVPPDLGLALSGGTSLPLADGRLGVFGALGYGSSWALDEETQRFYTVGANGRLELAHTYRFDELDHRTTLSAMLVTGLDSPRHTLRLTSLLNRISSDDARIYEGQNRDVGTRIRVTRLQWIEQMLWSNQLRGEHRFGPTDNPDLTLSWHYAGSLATRLEPDRRQTRYDYEDADDQWRLSDRPEGNRRVFSDLDDAAHELALSGRLRLLTSDDVTAHLALGGNALFKDRRVDTRRYRFQHQGPLSRDASLLTLPGEALFSPEHIGPDGFMLTETTLETDNYTADQRLLSTWLELELDLFARLDLELGVRLESSHQGVATFVPFSPSAQSIGADLTTLDLLPALSLSWEPLDHHLFKLGLARTVSRPDFRELSPATYNDVTGGRQYFGNPDLARATLTHVDLRWEHYPSARDLVSVGAFYKHFDRPIEVVVVPSAQLSVTFANAAAAHNLGLELELRKSLDPLGPALADLYLAGNLALIDSRVELDQLGTIQTSRDRALQGQSPWVVNLQLGWEPVELGTHVTLLWNVFGPRIIEVGALGAPDTYEQPFHQLDLVWQQRFEGDWELGFKAQNLIDPPTHVTQGGETLARGRRGRALSLSLSRTF